MPGGEVDPGLPPLMGEDSDADPDLSGVEHVHRGSHKDGEGAIPPALQEVLRNLKRALEQPMDVQASLEYLRIRQRKGVTFSTFLDVALKSKQGLATRHVSRTEDVLGILTGMSSRTLQSVFQGLRARRRRAKPCGGAGGRPVGRVVSVDAPEVIEAPFRRVQNFLRTWMWRMLLPKMEQWPPRPRACLTRGTHAPSACV